MENENSPPEALDRTLKISASLRKKLKSRSTDADMGVSEFAEKILWVALANQEAVDMIIHSPDGSIMIEAKSSRITSEVELLGPVTATKGDIQHPSDNPEDKAYIISPRKKAHRQVDQIYDSKNTKVKDALSRNLNVFCLVPGVSIEQTGDAPAESGGAKRESLNLRTQRVVRESDITDRDAGKAAEEIKRGRRTDRGDGEKAG